MATLDMELTQAVDELTALERIELVERILHSLDAPDSSIDALWAEESASRLGAWKTGALKAELAQELFPEL